MAKLPHANSRRMYSWWWDSHISPKNSRWLQENLTDMDAKVKSMIKLIEEDADSFARRAEMYYKKRPELTKMVEEFYRAYRALAERYDQSTRALLQASRTMTDNFPNQVPSGLTEDELARFANENDQQATDDQYSRPRKGSFEDDGKVGRERIRKGLNFDEDGEKEDRIGKSAVKLEKEIQTLKEALAKVEAEKESSLAQHKQSLDKLSQQERDFLNAQEDSKKAKYEVENLKIALNELEVENGTTVAKYQTCLEKIKHMEGIISRAEKQVIELNERAQKGDDEAQILKQDLVTIESQNATFMDQCKHSLEKISALENNLRFSEEKAKQLNKRAEGAEIEVEILKKALVQLGVEKEANSVQYQQCLDTISTLEKKFSYAEEEVHMLNGKLESGITKLKGAEEKCILLESKLVLAEEEAKKLNERAEEAETEAKVLRKAFAELGVENEANVVQYQQCLDNISILEKKISCAEEEVHMLNGELESGVAKLKGAEAKCTLLENKLVLAEEKAKKLNERAKEAELLKNMVSELGVEKEANAVRYQQSLDTISTLEKKISCAKEEVHMLYGEIESGVAKLKGVEEKCILLENNLVLAEEEAKKLNERAEEAETQVEIMKKALAKLDVEKKANDVQYQQCLDTISTLEKNISCAEEEVQKLNGEIESGVTKLKGAKEKCIFLEYNLVLAEVEAKKLNERAGEAETEAETMKKALAELGLEKKANDVQYQQCLDTISTLEKNLSHAEEEMHILNGEIEKEVSKLKGAEEKCILLEKNNQSLHSELQSLKLKIGAQREELAAKEHENGMLRTSVQDERFRFVEAETAFQTLQLLHAQTKDELKFLALELQNRSLIVSDLETHNQSLLNESVKFKEENERLNELNLASLLSIKNMHGDIISLMETNKRFEEEVELRVDQRNALQQDIYCLKEELNDLRVKYVALLDQVEAVGFNPECFQSAVKGLQDKNLNLKEIQEKEMREKMELLERIEKLEKVVDKNAFLEKSLSDLSRDLEGAREEIHALEKIFKSVSEEKSTLDLEKASIVTQLQVATGNLVKLSEKNTFMENSVSDALYEIERQKMRLKSFEDSCEILENEKLDLVNEKVALICQVEITRQILEDLEKKYRWLEEKHLVLEKEKESVLCEVVKLQSTMNESKQKEENQMVEIENLQGNILVMQKTSVTLKEDNSKLLDKKISLSKNVMDLQEKNNTLEGENLLIIAEAASLSNLSVIFKNIINEKSLEIEEFRSNTDKLQGVSVGLEDKISVMEGKLETAQLENVNLKKLLKKTKDNLSAITLVNGELNLENSKLSDEKISLVKDFVDLQERNNTLKEENLLILGETASLSNLSVIFKNIIDEKYLEIEELQSTVDKLQGLTVGFEDKIRLIDGKLGESQFENMKLKKLLKKTEENLSAITLVNGELNMENSKLVDDKISVVKDFIDLQEKNKTLDGENLLILGETASFCNLSVIFQNIIKEKSLTIEELQSTVDKLQGVTVGYVNKISVMEGKLGEAQLESTDLNKRLKKTEENLSAITLINCQLILEIGEKETEISEAKCKVADTENEKSVLQSLIEDLKEKIGEIQMFYDEANRELNNKGVLWEIEATKLTSELFTSSVIQFLLDEKYKELVGVLKTLEEETNSKDKGIEMHTKRINILEVENGEIRARFAEYSLAINSLKDCIFSLENRTSFHNKLQNGHRDKGKVGTENQNHVESHEGSIEGQKETNNLSDLQDLETIVKVVERTIIETNSKLEAATRQIQELGSEIASNNEKVKPVPVKFESGNRFLTKDTTFDEISESSSYGIGMKECINTHISDCDGNENFTKEKEIEFDSGITVEKELGLDKLAISKRFSLPNQELDKTKILERLNSDSEKLIKLQTTVQDLKRRVEIREKRIDGKPFGRESVGEQLVKAEVNIMQLSDVNGKLMKNVDNSDDVKSVIESEENRSLRRKFSEQARKVSERIGQLQLEVQKIQFTMLKFHSENATEKIKKKSKITETKRRTSLSNYIGLRTRKKRRLFCGCIHPPSTAD